MKNIIIVLKTRNHPGVMPHVVSLFSRKVIQPEIIYYKQDKNNNSGKIFLVMNNDLKKDQIIKQLGKLHDITDISIHENFFNYFKTRLYFIN